MITNRRPFLPILASLLLVAVAFSCKNSTEGNETTVDFQRKDNSVSIRVLNDADVLNPLLTSINTSMIAAEQVFQYLLTTDPETLESTPQLAKSLPVATNVEEGPYAGGLKFTFELFEEAVWDNGTPVTAEDYIFTVKALKIPGLANRNYQVYTSYLVNAEADPQDPKKLHVYFSERTWQAMEIAAQLFVVLPKHIYDPEGLLDDIPASELSDAEKAAQLTENSEKVQQFIKSFQDPKFSREVITGSGPYRFEEWVPGQKIVLNKKENWWGDALSDQYQGLRAYPDQITLQPIPEDASAVTALKAEEIDVVTSIPASDFVDLQNQEMVTQKYDLKAPETFAHYFLWVNTTNPKLNDKRVRKALAYAINKQVIIDEVYEGFGQTTASPVAPSSPDYNKKLSPIAYDPEKAKALLKEAGWEDTNNNGIVDKVINGERTELTLEYGMSAGRSTSEAIALLIKDFAQAVGIDVQPAAMEFTQGVARLNQKDYELFSNGLQQQPYWNPKQVWHSGGANRTGFGNAEMDQMIDSAELIMASAERRPIYMQIQEILHDEQPIISLMVPKNRIAVHKRFETPLTPIYPNFFPNLIKLKDDLIGKR